MTPIAVEDFLKVDIRVGRIVSADVLKGAYVPAYQLRIDFGALGIKQASARITRLYDADDLPGQLVLAVVNFAPKRIAGFLSEVLVLGVDGEGGEVLLGPDREVTLGKRIY